MYKNFGNKFGLALTALILGIAFGEYNKTHNVNVFWMIIIFVPTLIIITYFMAYINYKSEEETRKQRRKYPTRKP